ncbi:NUDIX domain-containing protein [Nitriliruptoraceae bacterium ZYF776]|nr:NUDIX domain-containing protein [Profundirhabdus halotolerans]
MVRRAARARRGAPRAAPGRHVRGPPQPSGTRHARPSRHRRDPDPAAARHPVVGRPHLGAAPAGRRPVHGARGRARPSDPAGVAGPRRRAGRVGVVRRRAGRRRPHLRARRGPRTPRAARRGGRPARPGPRHRGGPVGPRGRTVSEAGAAGAAAGAAILTLDDVAARVGARADGRDPARDRDRWQAATALVLAPGDDGLAAAFIQRVERPGDRWSGQMALPGGKRDPEDPDLAATAAREAAEEVGLELGTPLGRLADQRGRVRSGLVATYVFGLAEQHPMVPQPTEVQGAFWIPLTTLFDPGSAVRYRWAGIPFPGIAHGPRVIWGLTHRIVEDFGDTVGVTLPRP